MEISVSEKYLHWKHSDCPESVLSLMQEYQPIIQELYPEVGFWHSTGRFAYSFDGSKYAPQSFGYSCDTATADVWDSIWNDGGLVPHEDPWGSPTGMPVRSTSVAIPRMYGRLYAEIPLYEEGPDLEYRFGSRRFWWAVFILEMYKSDRLENMRYGIKMMRDRDEKASRTMDSAKWVSAFRKNVEIDSGLDIMRIATEMKSDIPGNYPLMFGIRQDAVVVNPDLMRRSWIRLSEQRTEERIPIGGFTHVEVPLAVVEQFSAELSSRYGLDTPVIPIEAGELFCMRNYSWDELRYGWAD